MRYQDDKQIGLFTFYKEQQRFEEQIAKLKQLKHQQQKQRLKSLKRKHTETKKFFNPKNQSKIHPYLIYHTERSKKQVLSGSKPYSQSLLINRKQTQEQKDYLLSLKHKSIKETDKQTGHFLSNKSMQLQLPKQQTKSTQVLVLSNRKKFWVKRNQQLRINFQGDTHTNEIHLPYLVSTPKEQESDLIRYEAKKINSVLKSPGNALIRKIRNSIGSQSRQQDSQVNGAVSYIEYNQGCCSQKQDSMKKNLNSQQKHLLYLLTRHRFKLDT